MQNQVFMILHHEIMYPPIPSSCGNTFNTNKIVTTVLKKNVNTKLVSGPIFMDADSPKH